MRTRYEINVADQNGWHMFATDSHVRRYTPEQVAANILLFQETFPAAKVSVTNYDGPMDTVVQAALDGTIDRVRLNKALAKWYRGVQNIRSNDYVGEAAAEDE